MDLTKKPGSHRQNCTCSALGKVRCINISHTLHSSFPSMPFQILWHPLLPGSDLMYHHHQPRDGLNYSPSLQISVPNQTLAMVVSLTSLRMLETILRCRGPRLVSLLLLESDRLKRTGVAKTETLDYSRISDNVLRGLHLGSVEAPWINDRERLTCEEMEHILKRV
jgi:hypothetical protein